MTALTKSERREEKRRKARSHKTDGRSVFIINKAAQKRVQSILKKCYTRERR